MCPIVQANYTIVHKLLFNLKREMAILFHSYSDDTQLYNMSLLFIIALCFGDNVVKVQPKEFERYAVI